MSFEWRGYLRLAEQLCGQRDDEAAMRTAISRAYYAAFNTAKRHKAAKDARSTQGGHHQAVWKALRRSGNASWRRAGNMGLTLMDQRQKADYEDFARILGEDAKRALGEATRILQLLST